MFWHPKIVTRMTYINIKEVAAMNRDEGQFNLSHMYDDFVVARTSGNTVIYLLLSTKQLGYSANTTGSSLHHQC